MKTARWLRMAALTLCGWMGSGTGLVFPQEPAARLEQERKVDNQMWQLMRQMLVDFGYSNKVAMLDTAWQKTATPQQWADAKQTPPAKQDLLPPAAERILARLPVRPPGGFSQFFTDVCGQGRDLREIVRVLVAWTRSAGQAQLQGRNNWTIHFIFGAAYELNLGLGYFAAVMKESRDQERGSVFSFDDMAASMAGAEWVQQVARNPAWLTEWRTGRLTLANNLPALRYGHGDYSLPMVERVHADILAAFGIHDEAPPTARILAVSLWH